MLDDALPQLVHSRSGRRRDLHHWGRPVLARRGQQGQGPAELGRGQADRLLVAAVGLVDREHVRQFQQAPLDGLQLVARAGQRQHTEAVDRRMHGRLGLADADGLHQHHVVAGRLQDRDRVGGRAGDTTERSGRWRGSNEGAVVGGQPGHTGLVAQDRSARDRAGGVDRQHADPVAGAGQPGAQGVDERRLARTGHAADTHPVGSPGMRQQRREQLLGETAVVGPGRLHQGDGPPQRRAVTRQHAGDQLVHA